MTSSRNRSALFACFALVVALLTGPVPAAGPAADLRIKAYLVWGSREAHPDKKLKELDPDLHRKLLSVFKWRHYFEMSRQDISVPAGKTQRTRVSKDCEVEVIRSESEQIRVRLIGKGKMVVDKMHSPAAEDSLVLAGPDRNDSAWFVVLSFR